jgi:hypothetical protein
VFTSPEATEASGFATEGVAVLDNCQDVIDSIPKLMRDEKNTDDTAKKGANEQTIPREVETQREIQKITSNTQKYLRYLELTAKRASDIAFTIPRRRWFH